MKQELIDILDQCGQDSKYAAGILFPERFTRPFDPIHDQIFEVLDRKPWDLGYKPRKVIVAPRGLGKTSIASLLIPSIAIILQKYRYIIVIGHNATDAIEKTEELKNKLVNNSFIRKVYGDVRTDNWSKDEYVVKIGNQEIKIHPRGSGQPVRGRLFRDNRPGLILVDDLEKTEETESEDIRKARKSWFFSDVLNSIDRGAPLGSWEIIVLGTILHQDSLLMNLCENKHWDSVVLEICDDNFKSNAPTFLPDEGCRALYEEFREANEIDVWYREYRSNPVPVGEDASFQPSFFRYYDESVENLNSNHSVENLIIVDPSRTAKMNSAPTGIVGLGVNMKDHRVFVRDLASRKLHPEEMYDEIAAMIRRLQAQVLAVEVTGLHEFIVHPLKTFLHQRGIHIEFVELHARAGDNEKGKTARVRTLVDFYRQGLVYHNKAICHPLESQLLSFPKAKDWSLMDPFGYLAELLEKGERYLSYPGEYDIEDPEQIEREFAELEYEYDEPLNGFRINFGGRT